MVFSAYYMAVGGTTETTKEKYYSLISPMVNVTENTCLSFEAHVIWEKNRKPHGLILAIESISEEDVTHVLEVLSSSIQFT